MGSIAVIPVKLSVQKAGKSHTLFEDTGRHAGFEAAGDLDRLLTKT